MMHTEVLRPNAAALTKAAALLRGGALVAFPTETVYGLGADALNPEAVAKIFAAKGRPSDNPLIAHIADGEALAALTPPPDARARRLMEAFWPGPLTLVLPRGAQVPDAVTAGLDTVAVRMPAHPVAQALIREAGTPIAAPSANRSGRPSPTTATHVLEDMQGRIGLILDGGASGYGLESTVLDLTGGRPVVLRPGGVTLEQLRAVQSDTTVDDAVLAPLLEGAEARSPGMRHRHYAPQAHVTVVRGGDAARMNCVMRLYDQALAEGKRAAILCAAAQQAAYGTRFTWPLGNGTAEMAANLFAALRAMDAQERDIVFAEATDTDGMGLALMNRLLRAADFDVVQA